MNPELVVCVVSLGCAKNRINSEQMMFLLSEAGYTITDDACSADVAIVNTCAFIESAKLEAIETIIELGMEKAKGRLARIIAAGCLPERYREEVIRELPEVDAVVGAGSFNDIVEAVASLQQSRKKAFFGDINAPIREVERFLPAVKSWEYLKVAEGCDNRCAYCAIPGIRGKFRSRPMEMLLDEARTLAAAGVKELNLVAQDLTRYGLDIYGKRSLAELLGRLSGVDGPEWIRLHYLYPADVDEALIEMVAGNDRILKYLDIPFQHINSAILKKMRRRGTGNDIRELVAGLRDRIPGLVIRTSIITGLPGEGDEEFEELCEFLINAKIERAGVFAYSPEEGTPAARLEAPDRDTAERRAELISGIQARIMDEFAAGRVGSVTQALVEYESEGLFYGRSYAESHDVDGYYLIRGKGVKVNDMVKMKITSADEGEVLPV